MKLAAAALALAFSASSAHAALISQSFHGTVDDGAYSGVAPSGTSYAPGDNVNGSFTFDTSTSAFTSFQIGGYTAPAGATTIFSPPLAASSFIYAGERAVDAMGNLTALLQINFFEDTPPFPSTIDIGAFLANPRYSTDLSGGSPSYFSVVLQDSTGAVVTSFGATLAPEPAALAVLAMGFAGLALVRRRSL